MKVRHKKHSVTINGRNTSISLEPGQWDELTSMANRNNISVNRLVGNIAGWRKLAHDDGKIKKLSAMVREEIAAERRATNNAQKKKLG